MLQIRWIKKKEEKGRWGREEKGREAGAEKKKEKEKQHSNKNKKKEWKLLLWDTWPFLPLRLSLSVVEKIEI